MIISRSKILLFLCFMLVGWSTWAVAFEDTDFQSDSRQLGSNEVAVEHYIRLAEKNDPHAQYILGRMYANGRRIERDYPEAYFWLQLAEMNGVADAAELKGKISRQMSGREIAEAHRRIEDWRHRYDTSGGSEIATPLVIRQVQMVLAGKGYYRGAIDGVPGERTREAIRRYQEENRLAENGRITPSLLANMGLTRYLPPSSSFPDSSDDYISGDSTIKQELRRIIRQAESEGAAEPWLIRRLEELAGSGADEWPDQVLREHFEARGYRGGEDWRTVRGSFTLEPGTGLVASSSSTWGSPQNGSDDLALTLLEVLLRGEESLKAEKLARLEKDISFADSFALRVKTGSLDSTEGLVFSVERQDASAPGYRFVFHPGKGERAKLFETYGENAREVISQAQPIRLEKRASHTFEWTRSTTGEMTVNVDGMELLQVNSPGSPGSFDRIGISHIGDRIAFKDIELSEKATSSWR